MPKRIQLTEARRVAEARPVEGQPGRFLIGLITPGWGSSGHYSPEVLEAAATDRVFPAGTHMYLDHPTESEEFERPERSVRDLAAVLNEDAVWDGSQLVAEATVFGPYREVLEQMAEAIGVSIRASAEVTEGGEAEGRRGRIVNRLVEGVSADFVTHAGRGGRIVSVLESTRPSVVVERAIRHGVAEATANDTREALQQALREEYGGEQSWVWVRDFDDTTVWFEHETPEESGTWAEGYTLADDGAVTLAGGRTEVRARTEYVPVNPAGRSITQESEEDTMPQIEEARLRELEEAAGRVQTLESERDTERQAREAAETERDRLREAQAQADRAATVARIVGEAATAAHVDLDEDQAAGIATRAVYAEDGSVNEAETRRVADERCAAIAEAQGAGGVRGFGRTRTQESDSEVTDAQLDESLGDVFGINVKGA